MTQQPPQNFTEEQKAKIEENYRNFVKRTDAVVSILSEKSMDLPVMASEIEQVRSLNVLPTIQMTLLSRKQIIDVLKKKLVVMFLTRNELLFPDANTTDTTLEKQPLAPPK